MRAERVDSVEIRSSQEKGFSEREVWSVRPFFQMTNTQSCNCHIRMYPRGHRHPSAGARLRLEELRMPDLDQIKQGEQEARDRAERCVKGRSGNPAAGPSAAT